MSLWCSFVPGIRWRCALFSLSSWVMCFSVLNILAAELIMDAHVENLGNCNVVLANDCATSLLCFCCRGLGLGGVCRRCGLGNFTGVSFFLFCFGC